MEPMKRKKRILLCVIAGAVLAAILAGTVLCWTVRTDRQLTKEKITDNQTEPSATEARSNPADPPAPAQSTETNPAEKAGDVSLDPGDLFPMERSENPRVVGPVELSYETKEKMP